jgi:hypothetical protein
MFPFKRPPILLLSYPRSGSSWIGRILSTSPDVAYLREPVNQGFQQRFGGDTRVDSVFDPHIDAATLRWYAHFADRAFAGIPPRNVPDVVDRAGDFSLRERRRRTLVIKEVNPLAADLLVARYAPKTILILRHPAAVADSYERLGWLGGQFEEFGRLYGLHLARAVAAVGTRSSLVVRYEDVARDAKTEFPRLFAWLGIRPPADLPDVLSEFCERESRNPAPYEIRRASPWEADKWRRTMPRAAAEAVMRGYLESSLRDYREDSAGV